MPNARPIRKLPEAGFKRDHAAVINELIDRVSSLSVKAGPGILLDQTSNGTVVKIDPNFTGNNNSGKPRWL